MSLFLIDLEEIDRVTDIRHFKQALKANNYPDWMITLPNAAPVSRVSEESVQERGIYASVPYIKGTSERLQRAFKSRDHTYPQAFQFLKITTGSC